MQVDRLPHVATVEPEIHTNCRRKTQGCLGSTFEGVDFEHLANKPRDSSIAEAIFQQARRLRAARAPSGIETNQRARQTTITEALLEPLQDVTSPPPHWCFENDDTTAHGVVRGDCHDILDPLDELDRMLPRFDVLAQSRNARSLMESVGSQHDLALVRRVGAYRWLERQLFHLLGSWAASVSQGSIKLFLSEQSFEYAWHAELWADRLPDPQTANPAGLTAPANPAVAALFRELVDANATWSTLEKLVAVYRVLIPRMVTMYSSHLQHQADDNHLQRALRLVIADEATAWRVGETHLQSLLVDAEAIDRAVGVQRRLESQVLASGGLARVSVSS